MESDRLLIFFDDFCNFLHRSVNAFCVVPPSLGISSVIFTVLVSVAWLPGVDGDELWQGDAGRGQETNSR